MRHAQRCAADQGNPGHQETPRPQTASVACSGGHGKSGSPRSAASQVAFQPKLAVLAPIERGPPGVLGATARQEPPYTSPGVSRSGSSPPQQLQIWCGVATFVLVGCNARRGNSTSQSLMMSVEGVSHSFCAICWSHIKSTCRSRATLSFW